MPVLWEDIIADPSFQAQPEEMRQKVANNYFKRHIETDPSFMKQDSQTQGEVHANFMLSIRPGDGEEAPPTQETELRRAPEVSPTPEDLGVPGLALPQFEKEAEILGKPISEYKNFGHVIGGAIQGTVEGTLALTTGVTSFMGATLGTGMGVLTTLVKEGKIDAQTLADAKDVQEELMESLTYAPRSEQGQYAAETLAMPFTVASEGIYMAAKKLGASEEGARAAQYLFDVALIFGLKGYKVAKGAKPRKPQMRGEIRLTPPEVRESMAAMATEKLREAEVAPEAPKVPEKAPKVPETKLETPEPIQASDSHLGFIKEVMDDKGLIKMDLGVRWVRNTQYRPKEMSAIIDKKMKNKELLPEEAMALDDVVSNSFPEFQKAHSRDLASVIAERDLQPGDRIQIINDKGAKEWFDFKEFDKAGDIILKNGETLKIDAFGEKQVRPVIGIERKGKVASERKSLVGALVSEEGAITLKRTPIRDAMDAERSPTANKVQKVFDEQRAASDAAGRMKPGTWLGKLNRAIVDVSGNAKNRLLKEAGAEGRKAVKRHEQIAGASAKANMEVGSVIDAMTKGLAREQYEYMNDYIQAKRALAISEYKKDFEHAGGIKTNEYVQWMETLPKETRAILEERSQIFFDTMQKKLSELREEGLISEESYRNLVEKGDYAPRKLREYLEVEDSGQFGGKKISVEGAGIKKLKEGDIGLLENDAQLMLREVVGRVEHRIARNRANRALHDIAVVNPENGIVIIGKVKTEFLVKSKAKDVTLRKFRDPEKARAAKNKYKNPDKYEIVRRDTPKDKLPPDKDYVNVVVDGKTVPLILDREFARDWVMRETVIDPNVANIIQWASGSKILRLMATGINPEFAITNLPRDMARALIVTEEFSPHLPVGLAQLGKDMAAVTADTFLRKGRYKDYINEGGGMSFLTHQGQTFGKPGSGLAKVSEYLGYIGESSEIMVRLAIRERSIKNQLKQEGKITLERMKEIQEEGTYIARNQLDFAQGGWLTKTADNATPYINAAVQGTRGMFRAYKRNKARFAYQIGQIGALSTGLYYMNYYLNPEAYEQTSDRDKANNWIFTTPFWYKDNQGNKRYYVGKIAKDQSQRVFTAMFEGLAAKAIGEDVNEDMIVQTITDLTPVGPTDFLPPTVEAALGYAANKDFWRNEDIWKSRYAGEVEPEEEYTTYTPAFFVQAGEVTGMSPERLKFALSQVFTHRNIYTDMGGYIWKQTMDNMPEDDQERTSEEMMLKAPGIRKFFARTDPYYAQEKEVTEAKVKASTERLKQNRELDSLSQQYINKSIKAPDLINFINKQEPTDRRRLLNRHKRRMKLKDLPNRRWWLDVAEMDPESRAIEFYRVYKDSSKKEKQEMRFNAQKVDGMTSERFRSKVISLMREGKK